MHLAAGDDCLAFVRGLLRDNGPDGVAGLSGHDLKLFDGADAIYQAICEREAGHVLARRSCTAVRAVLG